jgi:hypothetical protein
MYTVVHAGIHVSVCSVQRASASHNHLFRPRLQATKRDQAIDTRPGIIRFGLRQLRAENTSGADTGQGASSRLFKRTNTARQDSNHEYHADLARLTRRGHQAIVFDVMLAPGAPQMGMH